MELAIGDSMLNRRLKMQVRLATWMLLGGCLNVGSIDAQMPMRLDAPKTPSNADSDVAVKDQGRSFGNHSALERGFAGRTNSRPSAGSSMSVRRLPPVESSHDQRDLAAHQGSTSAATSTSTNSTSAGNITVPGGGHQQVRLGEGRKQLQMAYRDIDRGALASAESSAWLALIAFADASDCEQASSRSAKANNFRSQVQDAKIAMREARDFSPETTRDPALVEVRRRSHRTEIEQPVSRIHQTELVDLYLDFARKKLIPVATHSVDAAESMDVLASIILKRNRPGTLAVASSLCFRRAALAGQPGNASLAYVLANQLASAGLRQESFGVRHYAKHLAAPESIDTRVLVDSIAVTPETLQIEQVDPAQFASISRDLLGSHAAAESHFGSSLESHPSTTSKTNHAAAIANVPRVEAMQVGYRVEPTNREDAELATPQAPTFSEASDVVVRPTTLQTLGRRLWSPLQGRSQND